MVGGATWLYGAYSQNYDATLHDNQVIVSKGENLQYIYGGYLGNAEGDVIGNRVSITGENVNFSNGGIVWGGYLNYGNNRQGQGSVDGNQVTMSGTKANVAAVYGGDNTGRAGTANGNAVILENVSNIDSVYGGRRLFSIADESATGEAAWNIVHIRDSEIGTGMTGGAVFGGFSDGAAADIHNNTVEIIGGSVGSKNSFSTPGLAGIAGGYRRDSSGEVRENRVFISGTAVYLSVYGGGNGNSNGGNDGRADSGDVVGNIVCMEDSTLAGWLLGSNAIYGGYGNYKTDKENASQNVINNRVYIGGDTSSVEGDIYGGYSNGNGSVSGNSVNISGGSIEAEPSGLFSGVYGGYSANQQGAVTGNLVAISGGTIAADVYGGYSKGTVKDNTVALRGTADVTKAALYGSNSTASQSSGNALMIDGWIGSTKSVQNFNGIAFHNLKWNAAEDQPVLRISGGTAGDLKNTVIGGGKSGITLAAGQHVQTGESMTLIHRDADDGLDSIDDLEKEKTVHLTSGVTEELTGKVWQDMENTNGDVKLTINDVRRSAQTDVVAENRLAGAAFVNQGADIAADSLHLLDDGYHWGTQTFGAVYGNRSKYDVNSDLKINGWSEIVGAGNIHRVKDGRLAWGVFYENGTGNYRTWNEFNNETFRGDGSLVYNGGGAAVRLTKDGGAYYEASFRAGMLNSSMSDAVRDGEGNSYGFDSDSTYWGVHVGAGRLIRSGGGQWDVYGKYFHTHIDGDSFYMGGDRFTFDSVTSDRLRIGARYMADTEAAWKVYYGAAYEYEFSGDSHMKAGRFDAPEQSLQGSTVFGEIGTVWGRKDSPWSMDINLRGYTGEREGFSGMVQLAYAF